MNLLWRWTRAVVLCSTRTGCKLVRTFVMDVVHDQERSSASSTKNVRDRGFSFLIAYPKNSRFPVPVPASCGCQAFPDFDARSPIPHCDSSSESQ